MENMEITKSFWKNKNIFLTGHTGFKGGWLAFWLSELGANVHGYALKPHEEESFFNATNLVNRLSSSTIGDIRDADIMHQAFKASNPDLLIHMAAQPLVRDSYKIPQETFETNVIGTVNVLEMARNTKSVKAILNITTDKCYENKEWVWAYRENDRLGGHDPYSASKACAELVSNCFMESFFKKNNQYISTARAGNVIGGGDWSPDRLVPDFLRSIENGKALKIRSPQSQRPWQHVLEPVYGYLLLAEKIYCNGEKYFGPWNFGPEEKDSKSVEWIVNKLCDLIPGSRWEYDDRDKPHEANLLKLDSSKAKKSLNWNPRWDIETSLTKTIEWHKAWKNNEDMEKITLDQIMQFSNLQNILD